MFRFAKRWSWVLGVAAMLVAQESGPMTPRVGELERLGQGGRDLMILGLDAPGFEKLKPSQRKFAYYMYRAAIAGDPIAYRQNHRFALEIKELLEEIHLNREGKKAKDTVDPVTLEGLMEYLKMIWAHHGQYDHYDHTKFVPRNLSFDQLKKAALQAKRNGADFKLKPGESLERKLARLKPHIFDPKFEAVSVSQEPGKDPIASSASGLYDPKLTLKHIEALPKEEQNRINQRFALKLKKGKAVASPEIFRIDGVYSEELKNVAYWLKKALMYVEGELVEVEKDGVKKRNFLPNKHQYQSLVNLLEFYETGDEAKFRDHCIAWLKSNTTMDYLNGFIETYKDPRGIIGAWQGNVSFKTQSEVLDKLTAEARYFESKMPWKEEWKRTQVETPLAVAVNILVETGDGGPISPAAYNLPNYADIRIQHGSKNVMLMNLENARSEKIEEQIRNAFFLPEDRDLIKVYGAKGREWRVYLHEILGHGSGKTDASLQGKEPATLLGGVYSALEEAKADCVALYTFLDPKIAEIAGMSPEDHTKTAQAMYLRLLVNQLQTNGRVEGEWIRSAHERANQLMLNWLLQPGQEFGLKLVEEEGHFYLRLTDLLKAHKGIGELLAKLQAFKAMGDKVGAEELFEKWGNRVVVAWQKDTRQRNESLGLPKRRAFVFPQLKPIVESDGKEEMLKDVQLETRENFLEQMLRFRRWNRSRELDPKP